jgi:hypothetical protein
MCFFVVERIVLSAFGNMSTVSFVFYGTIPILFHLSS